MIKTFLGRVLLRVAVYSIVSLISVAVGPEIYMTTGRNTFFIDSYIAEINTPYYSNFTTIEMLKQFNAYGNGKAVNFTPKSSSSRTIRIRELETISGDDEVVGQAVPFINNCDITIEKGLDLETYYNVLLHEYLHCLGYTHNSNETDLMYYAVSYCSEENIKKYAKEIEERNK